MPRSTHPQPARKHDRAELRFQYQRWIERRWRQTKDRYGYSWSAQPFRDNAYIHPEQARAVFLANNVRWAPWPFGLARNEFARNPFNHCSCAGCQGDDPRLDRARSKRRWERELLDYAEEGP